MQAWSVLLIGNEPTYYWLTSMLILLWYAGSKSRSNNIIDNEYIYITSLQRIWFHTSWGYKVHSGLIMDFTVQIAGTQGLNYFLQFTTLPQSSDRPLLGLLAKIKVVYLFFWRFWRFPSWCQDSVHANVRTAGIGIHHPVHQVILYYTPARLVYTPFTAPPWHLYM